ncbi:hypothetical protein FOE78_12455 [Microlunatus elymi]|uniref:Uncharacterized protein n=1 Tax=Microlunatus elymi TaxID=2596828 RepID=A0A516PZL8_9ACTN|nr:hypothetical protein [Microlunatus elymi]QDP96614.1 hypothetical protein FOE78_12455 [Microlunatus elymi]
MLAGRPAMNICVLGADHHPLTLAVAGAVVGDLASNGGWTDPGHGVQLARQTLRQCRSLVWHRQLFGLQQPEPSFGRRWLSLLPSRTFLSQLGDDDLTPLPATVPTSAGELLYVGGPVGPELERALSATQAHRIEVGTTVRAPYRTKGSIELTALTPPQLIDAPARSCRTCDAGLVDGWCAFCNQRTDGPSMINSEQPVSVPTA